ncbi:uncharacterized protein J4E78_006651 [Alternaria triticimaculans]|uniref:uncharacterized protein n=1 Tax=Alternaria triticimaculans TaxID=297637 RepID=UPI0020C4BFD4|nr:uncharacterized protein J4E78_006651 [Alternaria triticimaculans]KAI4656760.1 hypothetical protein J4E78_006651 [Alternaria triticimaculans]
MGIRKANVTPIPVIPPTHIHWDNYLVPSLQAAYDFSDYRTRIKAVLLSNPNNPLSRCYPRETLRELLEFCQERGLHLIVDEGAGLMALDGKEGSGGAKKKRKGETFVSALSLTEPLVPEGAVKVDPSRVHVVWDASRLFGLGGLKIGCVVSQQNTPLLSSLALTATHPSSLSTIYLTSLLTSSLLPSLLTLNTSRMSTSYNMLASFLRRHDIEIVVPTHGPFLAAKLAKKTRTSEEENAFWRELEGRGGIKVAPGRAFNGVEKDGGWARVNFAVREEVMQEVVGKLEEFFGGSG